MMGGPGSGRKSKITEVQKRQIVHLMLTGFTQRAAAEKLGISRETVRRYRWYRSATDNSSYPTSLHISELSQETVDAIAATRMDPKHDHLNALLDAVDDQV